MDGVTAVLLLKETVQSLGGKVDSVYFPDREKEGYGITKKAIKSLKEKAPALLIAVDCGIGNFEEIEEAQKAGFEVMVVDHHQLLEGLPKAKIIVDPWQSEDSYPFKSLCAAVLVYKLCKKILGKNISKSLEESFLELAALATLADMMPKEEENKILIDQGLSVLPNTSRPGLKAFLQTKYFADLEDFNQKVSKIISILNIRDVEDGLPASYRLLTAGSLEEGKVLVRKLLKKQKREKKK